MGTPGVGVVVPAHNEQDLLPACLAALRQAAGKLSPGTVKVVLVADGCTDNTYEIGRQAQAAGFTSLNVIEIDACNVGAARSAGFRWLLERAARDVAGLWLATTDADSEVPADWLVRQLAHFARGAEAVVGTVRVTDWSESSPIVRHRYDGLYTATDGHRHTHGANLGFSANTYLAAGGFAAWCTDEDVALVQAIEATGRPMVWAADLPVSTSGRLTGRAPSGFAGYLQELAE